MYKSLGLILFCLIRIIKMKRIIANGKTLNNADFISSFIFLLFY